MLILGFFDLGFRNVIYDKFTASYEPDVVTLFKTELERVSKL